MAITRCAMVNSGSNEVENVIIADPAVFIEPGYIIVPSETVNIGDIYNPADETFSPPPTQ